MDIQVNLEQAVSEFTYAEKMITKSLLSNLDLSQDSYKATINMKLLALETDLSRAMLVNGIKTLCVLGVIATHNRGPAGTCIIVRNAEACRHILELCS
ncbi:MAG: hypothetical protein IJZ42_13115 [Lachnospiraceae bacterium]|nr:hypothetical protein [Lachnospiraceae bacterium]